MNRIFSHKDSLLPGWRNLLLFPLVLILFSHVSSAQSVTASVDTAQIKIGEQVTYSIEVELKEDELVVFPEGQTFLPMEMVESFPVDTLMEQDRWRFLKEYALTQFDSGAYMIPPQRVQIRDRSFTTDSILVEVADVVVDTTKQKLYPIKPSIKAPSHFDLGAWVWWILLILLLGLGSFLFFRRKKRREEAEKRLPPYEQAILELQQLDHSHLLENRELKEYYSQLSAAVRRYLDGEVYDHAMESTTGELVLFLEAERNSGKLKINNETIDELKEILHRADMAKFANSKPDVITAKEDRSKAEHFINDTKKGIPEPTEEELLKDKEYLEKKAKKEKQRKFVIGLVAVLVAAGAFTAYLASTKGFSYVVDTYFGHPTKTLLEGEWLSSEYGTPPVSITTPQVLKRDMVLTNDDKPVLSGNETFRSGSLAGNYFTSLTTVAFNQPTKVDLEEVVDATYTSLEKEGARNIMRKQEEFETLNGAKGIKIFGTLEIENPVTGKPMAKEYSILNFAESNGFQQITLVNNEGDRYANEITQRILNSVELKNAGN